MKKYKRKLSTNLKISYALLFSLTIGIIGMMHVEKYAATDELYTEHLTEHSQLLSIQLDQDLLRDIANYSSLQNLESLEENAAYVKVKNFITNYKRILDLKKSEINIILKGSNQTLTHLVSTETDDVFGTEFRDRTPYFTSNVKEAVYTSVINESLSKVITFNEVAANADGSSIHVMISAPIAAQQLFLQGNLARNIFITILIYTLLGLYFLWSMKKNRNRINQGLVEKQKLNKELSEKNKLLEIMSLVYKTSKDLIVVTDRKGIIVCVNSQDRDVNNYKAEEINNFLGRSLVDISHNENIVNIVNIIKNANTFKQSFTYETRTIGKNNMEFWTETTVTPVIKNDEMTNIIFMDRDITEQVELQEQLNLLKTSKVITANGN